MGYQFKVPIVTKKGRLLILDRAYDKAVKGIKLAELEELVLRGAILYSSNKAKREAKPRRDSIWARFGWDTPEGKAKWDEIRKGIINGKSV